MADFAELAIPRINRQLKYLFPSEQIVMTKESENDKSVREHVLFLLREGGAHIDFETLIAEFPVEKINEHVPKIPYSAWQVLEHMRIAQWDILDFCRNPNYVAPPWPEGYWQESDDLASSVDWQTSADQYLKDRKEIEDLIEDSATDLYSPIPHGTGQTILREALLVADHNSYHMGALVILKRLLT